jgi:uncharacterized protein YceK
MRKITFTLTLTLLFLLSGCTAIITAPIEIAGTVASTTLDVAGSATHAVIGSSDDD